MEVKLIKITDKPVQTIYKAYRICYSKKNYSEINEADYETMRNFIVPLVMENHTSPLEHVNLTFEINGISRACLAQLTRHRTMSFNVKSQRYVNENDFEYVIPMEIENNENAKNLFISHMNDIKDLYKTFKELGLKNEDARAILPNATTCNLVVTVDANNFRKFLGLRLCKHAQTEIRELAEEMVKVVNPHIPFISTGAMFCGKTCNQCLK